MATKENFKLLIPTGRNLLDFVTESLTNKYRDDATNMNISLPNIMDRAKILVKREGIMLLRMEKSNNKN